MTIRALMLSAALAIFTTATALADDKVDFTKQIQPIFVEHCTKCHGDEKTQGKLRLDTAAGLAGKMESQTELIVAGKPEESELYQRLTLPDDNEADAEDGRSAAEGNDRADRQLDQAGRGDPGRGSRGHAGGAGQAGRAKGGAKSRRRRRSRAAGGCARAEGSDRQVDGGQRASGAAVRGSSLLAVSFAHRDQPAGDAEVALLAGVAEQVYVLDLAGVETDRCRVEQLAALKNLSALHLELSSVTDAGWRTWPA